MTTNRKAKREGEQDLRKERELVTVRGQLTRDCLSTVLKMQKTLLVETETETGTPAT